MCSSLRIPAMRPGGVFICPSAVYRPAMSSPHGPDIPAVGGGRGTDRYSRPLLGVAFAALSSAALTVLWVIVRRLSERLHPWEITFFATFFGFLVLVPWFIRRGRRVFYTRRISVHLVRAGFNGIGIIAWFWALTLLPLADAAALNLLTPLTVTIGAMFFLGEVVKLRRWIALAIGLAGAAVIIRPGFEAIGLGVWLVLVTVLAGTAQRLLAKSLIRTESATTVTAYLLTFMTPVTLLPALFVWQAPLATEYIWFAAMGVLLAGAHFALAQSLKYADVSALEPVNFTRLVWAALLGFFVFAEVPDMFTWIGGAMIIVATTYVARREMVLRSQLAKSRSAAAPH